jgi:hypothetical protein
MNPPRRVKVSPFTFTVRDVRGLADAGSCAPDHEAILLDAGQADGQKRDTLLHESIHAIIRQGMEGALKGVDVTFEETLVSFLAPRVLALLRDNPALVRYLLA